MYLYLITLSLRTLNSARQLYDPSRAQHYHQYAPLLGSFILTLNFASPYMIWSIALLPLFSLHIDYRISVRSDGQLQNLYYQLIVVNRKQLNIGLKRQLNILKPFQSLKIINQVARSLWNCSDLDNWIIYNSGRRLNRLIGFPALPLVIRMRCLLLSEVINLIHAFVLFTLGIVLTLVTSSYVRMLFPLFSYPKLAII